jgi:hypothetical protein
MKLSFHTYFEQEYEKMLKSSNSTIVAGAKILKMLSPLISRSLMIEGYRSKYGLAKVTEEGKI